jgi:uncharacterized protein
MLTESDALTSPQDLSVAFDTLDGSSRPVDERERIGALDALRGFALLGILLMNIVAMGLNAAAYDNPTVTGGSSGANLWVWTVMHVLAEGKMRCLFSLVFGASVILLTTRLESRADAADIYYRRTLWLLLFGIVHAYLLWEGDILYPYALCGLVLYPFRKLRAKTLIIIGSILLVLNAAAYIGHGFAQRGMIEKGQAADRAAASGKTLSEEEEDARREYQQFRRFAQPTAEQLAKDAEEWRSHNPLRVIGARAKFVLFVHSFPYYHPFNWDIWCMMLIGMGLMKLGVLAAEKPTRLYALFVLIGYGVGIPVNSYTAWLMISSNFDPVLHEFAASTYDLGRLSIALGHLGLIMLIVKSGWFRGAMARLAAVGQMAFSNYVLHSMITAFLFTGYGFQLYGHLQRYQLYIVVLAIWVINLIVSPIWLRQYRFGPLEWCWRSLTYWKRQPMRRMSADAVLTA